MGVFFVFKMTDMQLKEGKKKKKGGEMNGDYKKSGRKVDYLPTEKRLQNYSAFIFFPAHRADVLGRVVNIWVD